MTIDTVSNEIILSMTPHLTDEQLVILRTVLSDKFKGLTLECTDLSVNTANNEHYIELFVACKAVEGLSKKTLRQYAYAIRRFCDEMQVDVLHCSTDHVRAYLAKKTMSGNCKSSINTNRAFLSSFFKWMADEGYVEKNCVAKIPKIKAERRQAPTLTALQFEAIRKACVNDRELALIDLLGSTGMRCSEVAILKISDIDFYNNTIIIHGKGSKDRIGRMNARLQVTLKQFLENRPYTSEYVFCRTNGKHGGVTCTSIERAVQAIANRIGLKVVVHMFRHYFCTSLIRKGMPVHEVQIVMGHEQLETTIKVYTEIRQDDVQHDLMKYSA